MFVGFYLGNDNLFIVYFIYVDICGLNDRFNRFEKKVLKVVDIFRDECRFDIDWDEFYLLVVRSCDFLKNEGIKFDFNDPVIMRFVKIDIEVNIRRLVHGEAVDILEFVHLNEWDDGKEIIKDLERFKIVLNSEIYRDTLKKILYVSNKGRPRFDVVLMFKIVVLQVLYNYSDNRIVKWIKTSPFKWFLDYPEEFPSESAFWEFKEKINETYIMDTIWLKHQQQLDCYGFGFDKDIVEIAQDSKIINSDQGNYNNPRGDKAKTRRSRDGTRVKKGNKWFFGYKLHQIMDLTYQLIRSFDVTTASVHDSQITFFMPNKVLYGDKGYVGVKSDAFPAYMLRKSNDPLTNEYRKQRNNRISRKRALVERPFSFLEHWKADNVKTTTIPRTKIRMLFACIIFNIKQTLTLQKQEKQRLNENKKKNEPLNHDLSIDLSIINGQAEKRAKYTNNIKKRRYISRKNRKSKISLA